jgi:hypothetical protein
MRIPFVKHEAAVKIARDSNVEDILKRIIGDSSTESDLPKEIDRVLEKIHNYSPPPEMQVHIEDELSATPNADNIVKNENEKNNGDQINKMEDRDIWKPTYDEVLMILGNVPSVVPDFPRSSYHDLHAEKFMHMLSNKPTDEEWNLFVFLVRDLGSSLFLGDSTLLSV